MGLRLGNKILLSDRNPLMSTELRGTIAVRLEGGIGDHLLGMRLLRFIARRYPDHSITVYSDAGGSIAQMDVARMSPFVSDVVPVFQERSRVTMENLGQLNNLRSEDLDKMRSADVFVDGFSGSLFLQQTRMLDVPFFEVLASLPDLVIPDQALDRGQRILQPFRAKRYIGLNLAKYGADALRGLLPTVYGLLEELLKDPYVFVLNIFASGADFPHWPEPERSQRRSGATRESEVLHDLSTRYPNRVCSVIDESIAVVAALLSHCSYFIGVDNGIKHLAWALDIPRSWIGPWPVDRAFLLRWAPDYHRMMILRGAGPSEITAHLTQAREALAS